MKIKKKLKKMVFRSKDSLKYKIIYQNRKFLEIKK